ncbi:MAG: hypothetical protein L3J66_09920 [Bacteroidales bacterium]|nr:hypothetical protein [Bacteroidales bacterium]
MKAEINKGNSLLVVMLVFAFTGMLLLSNCKKPEEDYQGKATGQKNGEYWGAECFSNYASNHEDEFYLKLLTYSQEGYIREDLTIIRIPLSLGDYIINKIAVDSNGLIPVNNMASYATLIDDGDVLDDYYDVLELDSATNKLNITSIDFDNLIVKGEFSVSFVLADSLSVSDTIRFSNVEFQTQIRKN